MLLERLLIYRYRVVSPVNTLMDDDIVPLKLLLFKSSCDTNPLTPAPLLQVIPVDAT